jgi:hypothetical protein
MRLAPCLNVQENELLMASYLIQIRERDQVQKRITRRKVFRAGWDANPGFLVHFHLFSRTLPPAYSGSPSPAPTDCSNHVFLAKRVPGRGPEQ